MNIIYINLRDFKPSGHFRVAWFNQCGPNHFIYTINQMCKCLQMHSGILLEEVKKYQQILLKIIIKKKNTCV